MTKNSLKLIFLFCFSLIITSQFFAQGVKREIIWSDYPYPIPEEFKERIKFGHIIVPETRNSDNPRTLKIAFCILKGNSDKGILNPVILLPGGPGGGMTESASYYSSPPPHWQERLEFMDVIFFDPRGCGKSEPDLCPDLDQPEYQYQNLLGRTEEKMEKETKRILKKCLDSLTLAKVNLNAYGSDEVAEDIEDLRVSIGVEKWNIQGASYGTRFGQGLIRNFPHTVKSAVFLGLVPTVRNYEDDGLRSFSRSLQLTLKKCAEDPDCASKYPDLENKLFEALEYYNQNPLVIPSNEQKLVKNQDVIINGDVLFGGIFYLSYGPVGIEIIPSLIQAIADKKEWVIKNFVNSIGDMFSGNRDMNLYINCNDNPQYGLSPKANNYDDFTKKLMPYSFSSNRISQLERGQLSGIRLDSTQEVPIPSEVPVLLSTGTFDPITPPEHTIITSKYLTNSVVSTFPGESHGSRGNSCYSDIITAFYKNPEKLVSTEACIGESQPIIFVTDISDNKGITQIGSKILMGKQKQVYIPLGISLFLILFGFIGIPVYALIRFFKRRKNKDLVKEKFNWLPWIMTLLVFVFVTLLYFTITATMERNTYILGFGILSSWNWISWIVHLLLIILIYSLLKRNNILNRNPGKFSKFLTMTIWIGTTIFIGLLFYWNVLWPFSS